MSNNAKRLLSLVDGYFVVCIWLHIFIFFQCATIFLDLNLRFEVQCATIFLDINFTIPSIRFAISSFVIQNYLLVVLAFRWVGVLPKELASKFCRLYLFLGNIGFGNLANSMQPSISLGCKWVCPYGILNEPMPWLLHSVSFYVILAWRQSIGFKVTNTLATKRFNCKEERYTFDPVAFREKRIVIRKVAFSEKRINSSRNSVKNWTNPLRFRHF